MDAVKAVVTIGAPFEPSHVIENFEMSLDEITETGAAKVPLEERPFTIKNNSPMTWESPECMISFILSVKHL